MPDLADILQYRHFRNTAFPYVTATAPTSSAPNYVDGLNLLTSYKGYAELRPGFDVGFESAPRTFADPIKRIFCWRRWAGQFYIMICSVGTTSQVWKLAVGSDPSFVNIFTSASSEPFDFVVSNNFCFFGNGTDMQKFDGTTVSNWGIAISSVSDSTTAGNGSLANGVGTAPWSISGIASATVTLPAGGTVTSTQLLAEGFGFSLLGTTITGIQVTFNVSQSNPLNVLPGVEVFVNLVKGGASVGISQKQQGNIPNSATPFTFGGISDLWNTTWSAFDVSQANFGVAIEAYNPSGRSSTFSVDTIQITIFGKGGPNVSHSGSGTFSATLGGYQYVYCYYNAATGHVSSPTPPSQPTGNFTNAASVGVSVVASSDPQVTNIRLFRTPDGGGGNYFEVAQMYPNATGTITDSTADTDLSNVTAPTFGFNDPPPPQMGLVWFANRIWGFNNNTLYFTDWEEMNIGVPEEGSTSGPAGNFWKFGSEITGLSVVSDGVLIFLAGEIWKISGDSLLTFWRSNISHGLGCRNRACISSLGGTTAFLANTNSVWTSDGNSLNEISKEIQPTLDNLDITQASLSFHFQGQYRWLVVCDPSHQQCVSYDLMMEQWMVPWSINSTAITSGETSPGTFSLLIGQVGTNRMLQLIPGQFTDNGTFYPMRGKTNAIPLVNEHLSSGSPIIDLFYPQAPEHVAELEYVGMETNAVLPDNILRMFDDDPTTATYVDITANRVPAPLKTVVQGANVFDTWTYDRAWSGKRVSVYFRYNASGNYAKLYTITLAYKQVR